MIQGVNVVNTIHNEVMGFGFSTLIIIALSLVTLGIIFIVIDCARRNYEGLLMIGLAILFIGGMAFVTNFQTAVVVDEYDTYEVYLDDTVNIHNFASLYEVVNQRGTLYEIRIRDRDKIVEYSYKPNNTFDGNIWTDSPGEGIVLC